MLCLAFRLNLSFERIAYRMYFLIVFKYRHRDKQKLEGIYYIYFINIY